ncbi:transcriptional regulator, BadM/Rrf2 family [Sinomicrobium oceani]|uniref:Transcriptional regulator, BadM/Rrf2 family n=1 Tax=Sinomicrobium oceani TaxID=1150368 RepID=A0A1K1QGK0_9FLAO|nr:Rrf2 family transcriptional regulator [Sinomicrobium oceani]SFW59058.1 transcriptional regulator, BadM/Rrf2 family [Sinomicrobium oceani]
MLSRKAKYALKAVVYLSDCPRELPVTTKEIAESEGIPLKFLEAILTILTRNNILRSYRGIRGGYTLARSPEDITVLTIMRIIDGPVALTSCSSENYYQTCEECVDEANCKIKKMFKELRESMLPILEMSIAKV